MSISIRKARIVDQPVMAALMWCDAVQREQENSALWPLKPDARERILSALKAGMEAEAQPFRQQWLVAESDGEIVGLTHSILLPVPPIYAGAHGAPGLIMEDCALIKGAPAETAALLLAAAETDLREAGAEILLASSSVGGDWGDLFVAHDYEPLTLYLAQTDLQETGIPEAVRKAQSGDVPDIVALSAENRKILFALDAFWKPHSEADVRFENWMNKSLTLGDRDMFVLDASGQVDGYAISQPATPLHIPPAHEIAATGVIDDFYHVAFCDPATLVDAASAKDLLSAACDALSARSREVCIVVCPAKWLSKIAFLKGAGCTTAIVWYIKR